MNICTCITESFCCTPETNTTLFINYTPIKKKPRKENNFRCSATFTSTSLWFCSQDALRHSLPQAFDSVARIQDPKVYDSAQSPTSTALPVLVQTLPDCQSSYHCKIRQGRDRLKNQIPTFHIINQVVIGCLFP